MKTCGPCEDFKKFDSLFGGIKILIATPYSLEGMNNYEGQTKNFREVWEFKYCPFCMKKIKKEKKEEAFVYHKKL